MIPINSSTRVSELDLLASPVIIRETEPMPSNEPEASTSEGPLHGEEPFSVIVDNGLPPLPKPLPKLPKSKVHSGPYHLVIVIESDLSSFGTFSSVSVMFFRIPACCGQTIDICYVFKF